MGRYKHHAEGDKDEEEDMIPSDESEMVAVLHEIMEDGINYYSKMSLGGTHGQRQYFKGMINALNITLKEINQLGPAKGLMRIKKVHRKQVHDRIKHRKTENLPFDAGLIDGFDEAAHRIIEMTYPLYVGAGYSKGFQKEMMAESLEAEGCPLCGKIKPHCINICDTHGGSVKCKCSKQGWSSCAYCEQVTCEPHTLSTGDTPWAETICPDCANVEWEAESFKSGGYIKKKPICKCGAKLEWDNVRKAGYCIVCPFNTYPKDAESFEADMITPCCNADYHIHPDGEVLCYSCWKPYGHLDKDEMDDFVKRFSAETGKRMYCPNCDKNRTWNRGFRPSKKEYCLDACDDEKCYGCNDVSKPHISVRLRKYEYFVCKVCGYEHERNVGAKKDAESDAYLAEWGAESNKMKAAILRGIQAAIREEYATFESKPDIAATVNMILRELGQLEGDENIEMIDVAAGPAIRIDPYDVVAAMAKAANQMDDLNKENMVCWDLPDRFLNSATKRLGWGLQSVFGIHVLSAKVDGKPTWRVSGYPQAIETWFMLYNSLRINLEKEMKGIKKAKAEQFYQAFTMHIRENDNVAKMIEGNADHKEKARELSKDCFPVAEVTKFIPVETKIEERAKMASKKLEPFGSEGNITEKDYIKYAKNNPNVANRLDSDDMLVFFLGVAVGTVGTFIGNIWSHKYIKQMESPIKKD